MAGFLSYGSGKALSYQHDYGKDMDRLYQREAYKVQVEAERQRKSAYYASLMKQHPAAAEYNQKRLEQFYLDKTSEVADFAMKHPNWQDDVMQTQKMNSIMDSFLNNDIVREDLQVQAEWEKVKQAYSSKQITQAEYDENAARYEKYRTEGGDAFVFANPKRKEMPEILESINKQLAGKQYDYTNKKTGEIMRVQQTSDADIHFAAISALTDPEIRRAVELEYNNIPTEDKGAFKSLTDFFMQRIKTGEEFNTARIGYDELYAYQAKKSYDGSTYHRHYLTNVYEPLARGENISPHDALLAFSSYAEVGNVIAFGTDATARGEDFKAYGKDNTMSDISIKGSTKALGSAGMKMIGGVAYVGTTIQVLVDPELESLNPELTDEEKKLPAKEQRRRRKEKEDEILHAQASSRKMVQDLEDHGFTVSMQYEDSLLPSFNGSTRKASVYVGTVWEPAKFDEMSRKQYDMTFSGQKDDVAKNAMAYDENINVLEAISQGNLAVLNSVLKYEPDSEDPNIEYAEHTDPNSGKTFIFKRDKTTNKTLMNVLD